MKIKTGDQVLICKGKDRGKKGKVTQVLPRENQVVVEGANVRIKHLRPRRSGEKGERIQFFAPLSIANVKLICPKCSKPTRVGYKIVAEKKFRLCKKCNQTFE